MIHKIAKDFKPVNREFTVPAKATDGQSVLYWQKKLTIAFLKYVC